VIWASK